MLRQGARLFAEVFGRNGRHVQRVEHHLNGLHFKHRVHAGADRRRAHQQRALSHERHYDPAAVTIKLGRLDDDDKRDCRLIRPEIAMYVELRHVRLRLSLLKRGVTIGKRSVRVEHAVPVIGALIR